MTADVLARIRRFNRAVTLETGALDASFLGRGRPLAAARVLWMIAPKGTDVADIRATLRIDSGQLSRILRRLEAEGMVTTAPAEVDRRRRILHLTEAGQAEQAELNRLNDELAARMLARLGPDPDRLVAAMDRIAAALGTTIAPADPEGPEARACLSAYLTLLHQRIPGITAAHVPDPDPEAASYRPPKGAFLLAHADGRAVACVALKAVDATTGEVKRLWVADEARGMGLARAMMAAIEAEAGKLGFTRLRLDTNENLPEAIALYRRLGWDECAPFTPFPATHWFTKLVAPAAAG